jgi:hypothetical protein
MKWLFPYHIPYQSSTNIIPRAKALGMILVSRVDYRMWYWKSHIIFSIYQIKHWFCWKYQYKKYMFNFIDNCSFISVSGCVGMDPSELLCQGPIMLLRRPWQSLYGPHDVFYYNTEQDFLMFKYMINIIWNGSFHITSRINSRPISSLELKLSGWYWCLGLITGCDTERAI